MFVRPQNSILFCDARKKYETFNKKRLPLEVNIQQYIYESIILAVPIKKIHPGVEDGTLQSEILDKLEELRPGGNQEEKDNETDPRWDNLKKLLTDK